MPKVNFKADPDNIPLRIGKYKGKTPNQIAKDDPSYIVWLGEKINPCPCSRGLILDCDSAINDHDPDFEDTELDDWARGVADE